MKEPEHNCVMRRLAFLLDENMPKIEHPDLDVLHAREEINPGTRDLVLLNRAVLLERTLATKDKGFLRAGAVRRKHYGVVVVTDTDDLQRTLLAFQSCLFHCLGEHDPANEVFLIKAGAAIYHKHPDGDIHFLH